MDNSLTYTSAEGLQSMKDELVDRIKVQRLEIANKIYDAKEMGDLSENFAYHEAKEQQAQNETRISNLREMIADAVIIETKSGGRIGLGSSFTAEVKGVKKDFEIVGESEANPMAGKISNVSPLGSAFMGASKGEIVEVTVPSGVVPYTIVDVK